MQLQDLGKVLILLAAGLAVFGGMLWIGGRLGLGSLPGDIHLQRGGWSCFVPIVSMIVVSVLLTLLLNLAIRFLR